MDNCTFKISLNSQNFEFSSETELNSFLRNNRNRILYGNGIKFSKNKDLKAETLAKLEELRNHVEKRKDGIYIDGKKFQGVTKFLEEARVHNQRVVAEFITDNIRKQLIKKYTTDGHAYATAEQMADDDIEGWKISSEIGNVIHSMAEAVMKDEVDATNVASKFNTIPATTANKVFESIDKFKQNLKKEHGDDAVFLTEYVVYDDSSKVAGIVDLLVIDKDGAIHMYDYKTASKNFQLWDDNKRQHITYQQLIYKRIIENQGLGLKNSYIIPIELDSESYTSPSNLRHASWGLEVDVLTSMRTGSIDKNIDVLIPMKSKKFDDVVEVDKEFIEFLDTTIGYTANTQVKERSLEQVKISQAEIEGVKIWRFYNKIKNGWQTFTSEEEAKKGAASYIIEENKHIRDVSDKVKSFIKLGKKVVSNGGKLDLSGLWGAYSTDVNNTMLQMFEKYISSDDWVVIDNEQMKSIGILAIANEKTKQIDLFSFSANDLEEIQPLSQGDTMFGNFMKNHKATTFTSDKSSYGNKEMYKVGMFILANEKLFAGYKIGGTITALQLNEKNEIRSKRRQITNIVMGNVNSFLQTIPIKSDKVQPRDVTIMDARSEVLALMASYLDTGRELDFAVKKIQKHISETFTRLSNTQISNFVAIQALDKLQKQIKAQLGGKSFSAPNSMSQVQLNKLSELITRAKLELGNVQYSVEKDIANIGNIIDHNATFSNMSKIPHTIIQSFYRIVKRAIGETLTMYENFNGMITPKFEDFYKAVRPSTYFLDVKVIGNVRPLFKNLMEFDPVTGKNLFRLKDPTDMSNSLTPEQRKFIKFYLDEINKIRFENGVFDKDGETEEAYLLNPYDLEFRNIPLMRASLSEKVTTMRGDAIAEAFGDILNPNNLMRVGREDINKRIDQMNEVQNVFRYYDMAEHREEALKDAKDGDFETDLEYVMRSYALTHFKTSNFNKEMPLFNAIKDYLMMSSFGFFNEQDNAHEAVEEYLKFIVFGKPEIDPESQKLGAATAIAGKASAYMSMALSLQSGFTDLLTGLWSNYIHAFSNTLEGGPMYNFGQFQKGMHFVLGETARGKVRAANINVVEQLNQWYGMSNMDIQQVINKTKTTQTGLFNFVSKYLFMFNGASDYMNRMAILTAQMIKDGILDTDLSGGITEDSALQFKDGRTVYDPKKDKRFKAYLKDKNGDNKTDEWYRAKSRYELLRGELEQESGGVVDGEITKPYSMRDRDSIKEYSDKIHGAYDKDNQIRFQRTILGKVYMQFKTWMIAKKDRYYMPTAQNAVQRVLKEGRDKDGNIFLYYENEWNEGIFQSLAYMYHELQDAKFNILKMDEIWNSMGDFRRQNIRYLIGDLLVYAIIALIGSYMNMDEKRKAGGLDYIAAASLINSGRDLFILETVKGAISPDRNPIPVIGTMSRLIKSSFGVMSGDGYFERDVMTQFAAYKNIVYVPFRKDSVEADIKADKAAEYAALSGRM